MDENNHFQVKFDYEYLNLLNLKTFYLLAGHLNSQSLSPANIAKILASEPRSFKSVAHIELMKTAIHTMLNSNFIVINF